MSSPSPHIPTSSVNQSLYPYPDQIHIRGRQTAKSFAESTARAPLPLRTLIIWADGSANPRTNDPSAGAITYIHPATHVLTDSIAIISLSTPIDSEILALWEAFRHAAFLTPYFDKLVVFSDCQSALCMPLLLDYEIAAKRLVSNILGWANEFYDAGIQVDMYWSPRDVDVEAQKRVDQLARAWRRITAVLASREMGEYHVGFEPISFAAQPEGEAIAFLRDKLKERFEDALARGTVVKKEKLVEDEAQRIGKIERAKKRRMLAKDVAEERKRRREERGVGEKKRKQALKHAKQAEESKLKKDQNSHFQQVNVHGAAAHSASRRNPYISNETPDLNTQSPTNTSPPSQNTSTETRNKSQRETPPPFKPTSPARVYPHLQTL